MRTRCLALIFALTSPACGDGPGLEPCQHDPEPFDTLPRVTAISPTHGAPGATVKIRGARFNRIDAKYDVAFGDFTAGCGYATLQGTVISDAEIEVVIPEDATLSGFIYLLADGLTVARSPARFTLEVDPTGVVTVQNYAQFPVVSVAVGWAPVLEVGDRIDIEDSKSFTAPAGVLHVDLCVGGPNASGGTDEWACNAYDGRLEAYREVTVTLEDLPAARFLEGDWLATWMVGEDVYEERLRVTPEGYWELRHGGRVVESGTLTEEPWTPYSTQFEVRFRPDEPIRAQVPVRAFDLLSPRARDYVTFRRDEE